MQRLGVMLLLLSLAFVLGFNHRAVLERSKSRQASESNLNANSKITTFIAQDLDESIGGKITKRVLATLVAPAPAQSDSSAYIGYGALTGNNVPCPPQSGRSYYTPNCQSATGPVNPYQRGCSTITNCARDSS